MTSSCDYPLSANPVYQPTAEPIVYSGTAEWCDEDNNDIYVGFEYSQSYGEILIKTIYSNLPFEVAKEAIECRMGRCDFDEAIIINQ